MSATVDLKTKEEKDAELDKRIEALRKKNEALVKRYQEIEEDKKKAEQEGIAVTATRKPPRPHEPETDARKNEKENLTVTVDLSKPTGEKRLVNDRKPGTPRGRKTSEESDRHKGPRDANKGLGDGHSVPSDGHRKFSDNQSPPRRMGSGRLSRGGQRGAGGGRQDRRDREPRSPREGEQGRKESRRGRAGDAAPGGVDKKSKEWEEKRRQNIEQMNEEMERIAEYERGQRSDGDKPIRNFLDDPRRSGPAPDLDRKEGSRRHVRNWGGLDFENVKTGNELEREWTSRRPGPKGSVDMTMSMTGRERAEYLRWKKEREQIDEERLARHRNATGQWRREWDSQKTESMFKEDVRLSAEGNMEPGSRRDDNKRPPKAPTFGDFLSQGGRGDRRGGRARGQKQNYSMHDNRWEGKKEEEVKEKEDKTKKAKDAKKNEKESAKPASPQKVEEKNENEEADEDDDEWEDASDGEEEEGASEGKSDSEQDSKGDEKKDTEKEKQGKSKDRLPAKTTGTPKHQRAPRCKVRIPPAVATQEPSEGGNKPLSPFYPLEGHKSVSDWGEEMEMHSPRSSMGAVSPLNASSTESSPPQKKDQQKEESQTDATEPHHEIPAPDSPVQQTLVMSDPEVASATASPNPVASDPTPEPVASDPTPEPVASDPTPEPVASDPTPEPVASDPTPEPVASDPTPEPVASDPIPEPVASDPTPEPLASDSAPSAETSDSAPTPPLSDPTPKLLPSDPTPEPVNSDSASLPPPCAPAPAALPAAVMANQETPAMPSQGDEFDSAADQPEHVEVCSSQQSASG